MKRRKLTLIGIIALILLSGVGEVFAGCWSDPGPCILQGIIDLFEDPVEFANKMKPKILHNPDPSSVSPLMQSYLNLLHPIFVVSIIIVSFYLIFMSGSPGGRAQAKNMFLKLLLTMVLVSLSLEIFKILLGISEALTLKITASVTDGSMDFGPMQTFTFFGVRVMFQMVGIWVDIAIGLRYMLVLIFAALFPLTIFLYFFEMPIIGTMTKETGAKLWRYTIGAIFAQVFQGAMLAVTVISFASISEATGWGKLGAIFVGIAGYSGIALVPFIAMGVLQWIGALVMSLGMGMSMVASIVPGAGRVLSVAAFAMTAAGGLMMGQGPASALMAGGGAAGMGFAMGKGRKAAEEAEKRQKREEKKRKRR